MQIKKVSPEYANAYKEEAKNFKIISYIMIGMMLLFNLPMTILLLWQANYGALSSIVILYLLCSVGLYFAYKNWMMFHNDIENLDVFVSKGIISSRRPLQRGFVYYFNANNAAPVEKIIILNYYGYDAWHTELSGFPLKVEIWRGVKSKKIIRIELLDSAKSLDIVGRS